MKIKLLLYLLLAFSFYFSSTIGQTTDSLKVEISQEKNKVRKIKLLKQLVNVFICPLHGGKAAGVFAGKGFGARAEQRDKQVLPHKGAQGRFTGIAAGSGEGTARALHRLWNAAGRER